MLITLPSLLWLATAGAGLDWAPPPHACRRYLLQWQDEPTVPVARRLLRASEGCPGDLPAAVRRRSGGVGAVMLVRAGRLRRPLGTDARRPPTSHPAPRPVRPRQHAPGGSRPPVSTERTQAAPVDRIEAPPILVDEITTPPVATCDEPGIGWIMLIEGGPNRRRVQYVGGWPSQRTDPSNRVPQIGHRLIFAEAPAQIFAGLVPCYLSDEARCEMSSRRGTFVVRGFIRFNAGPGGMRRWQLCLVEEREIPQ